MPKYIVIHFPQMAYKNKKHDSESRVEDEIVPYYSLYNF